MLASNYPINYTMTLTLFTRPFLALVPYAPAPLAVVPYVATALDLLVLQDFITTLDPQRDNLHELETCLF
jgi:hypothetical protein